MFVKTAPLSTIAAVVVGLVAVTFVLTFSALATMSSVEYTFAVNVVPEANATFTPVPLVLNGVKVN